ncbi:hypothetical protein ACIBL8_40220 [Streptomyces sp. NPDC050523]|uniref:hypothetical protein n=1 Tax=Streptomyces sp. NPDC050523 TaxID=3365622 RepID=UPI0037BD9E31
MKAFRKHARDGTLAPVLIWRVDYLDGWLILDGHDRAVAAPAEGRVPECVELTQVLVAEVTEGHGRRMAGLARRPAGPGTGRQRATLERAYADTLATLPYSAGPTRFLPLPGGPAAWDVLAARAVFQCPGD